MVINNKMSFLHIINKQTTQTLSTTDELSSYIPGTVAATRPQLQYVGKEEELEHGKYNYQLYQDDCPQHTTDRHVAETVNIESEYFI